MYTVSCKANKLPKLLKDFFLLSMMFFALKLRLLTNILLRRNTLLFIFLYFCTFSQSVTPPHIYRLATDVVYLAQLLCPLSPTQLL